MESASQTRAAASLRALLTGLIDYAGLFPPAGLSMEEAVANYGEYHRREGWSFLGTFIVPAARLREFEEAFETSGERCWCLNVTFGNDFANDVRETAGFMRRAKEANRVMVSAVEVKAESPEQIREYSRLLDEGFGAQKSGNYFEIPLKEDAESLLRTVRDCGARAKIRTGGLVPEAFPDARKVARFLTQCSEQKVAFKATAGLHHPLRCVKALTYEVNAPTGTMHGFLNVFVAAVVAFHFQQRSQSHNDVKLEEILNSILLNEDPAAITFGNSSMGVHTHGFDADIPIEEIENARERFCISFGSCSFEEPIEDLRSLNLL